MAINIVTNDASPSQDLILDLEKVQLEKIQENYSFEEVVQKVKNLSTGNLKVCLFVGRVGDEPLPNEEGEVWISTDINFASKPYSLDQRIHIWCDFQDEARISKFYRLFDKVVIDQSTCKGLGENFIFTSAALLKPSPESIFICEITPRMYGYPYDIKQPVNHFSIALIPYTFLREDDEKDGEYWEGYLKNEQQRKGDVLLFSQRLLNFYEVDLDEQEKEDLMYLRAEGMWTNNFRDFIIKRIRSEENDPSLVSEAQKWAIQDTKEHIGKFFQEVKLFTNTPYPYLTNYRSKADEFFFARGIRA